MNKISQWLIDFSEDRMNVCQNLCTKRALKYGDRSWQWKITIRQEILWSKVGHFALMKI
ncbi:hypothetical protein LCGC14_1967910 [marine sediment metagenome]|uniref:Uncharacterized protein n=1 Tax=marine sediment metagenome TaxID=412755 RepID=A0A0F9FCL8_9ZZZZ